MPDSVHIGLYRPADDLTTGLKVASTDRTAALKGLCEYLLEIIDDEELDTVGLARTDPRDDDLLQALSRIVEAWGAEAALVEVPLT